jgi:hypothetical protein
VDRGGSVSSDDSGSSAAGGATRGAAGGSGGGGAARCGRGGTPADGVTAWRGSGGAGTRKGGGGGGHRHGRGRELTGQRGWQSRRRLRERGHHVMALLAVQATRLVGVHALEHVQPARVDLQDELRHGGSARHEALLGVEPHGHLVGLDGGSVLLEAPQQVAVALRPAWVGGLGQPQLLVEAERLAELLLLEGDGQLLAELRDIGLLRTHESRPYQARVVSGTSAARGGRHAEAGPDC